MRARPASLSLISLSICLLVTARLHHSLVPEDPYAFPKYRVTFLNGQPLLNETAERWLRDGLHGGESEFLDQPWKDPGLRTPQFKGIEGVEDKENAPVSAPASSPASNYTLERMKLGPRDSYLCLIPPPSEDGSSSVMDEPQTDVTPVHSWSLLQPLTGTCLYHKQGWFTYSYCHNLHVRQFHELPHQHPHRPGGYTPEEDSEWEAYTLGRAPPTLEPGADLTIAEEAAAAANLELARSAGSRYLVQRWGDGTYCDKTGTPREIEVQFHCSMTMTDTILFVKETQTCHYVLHIATPRLCGEPGFRSRLDSREEAYIRCREILGAEEYERADRTLPPADHPFKVPKRTKPVIAPPPSEDAGAADSKQPQAKGHTDILRKALEQLLSRTDLNNQLSSQMVVEPLEGGDGELVIEFLEADLALEGEDNAEMTFTLDGSHLADVLRAAGYDIKGEKNKDASKRKAAAKGQKEGEDQVEEGKPPVSQRRDEL
ncbi:hypothetical protein AcW1_005774 [Taiwanofungus camphoratus]|nr:hypothetical protein AcW1_005774 [Antrodia cinnamomea]